MPTLQPCKLMLLFSHLIFSSVITGSFQLHSQCKLHTKYSYLNFFYFISFFLSLPRLDFSRFFNFLFPLYRHIRKQTHFLFSCLQLFHMPKAGISIAYFPIRGKAQVARLLCEYLAVDYEDQLFSIADWDKEKREKLKNHSIKQLPYLQQGKFRVSGSIPMCLYIIDRFSNGQLLGKTQEDKAIVDMYLWTIDAMSGIIKMNCQKKSQDQIRQFKEHQWRTVVSPKLQKYEDFAKKNNWFIGYLTIVDFSIYELMRYIELIFGQRTSQFPKLIMITQKIGDLAQIKNYQQSRKAIKEMCPTSLLRQIKLDGENKKID